MVFFSRRSMRSHGHGAKQSDLPVAGAVRRPRCDPPPSDAPKKSADFSQAESPKAKAVDAPGRRGQRRARRRGASILAKAPAVCTSARTVSASTSASASSRGPSSSITETERDLCTVTGVYAEISDDYRICPTILGKGHYGVVRECIHIATRQRFAVKTVPKSKVSRLHHLRREIALLASLEHDNVMRMVDCYEDADSVHIITEKYTGGELFDLIAASTDARGCHSERCAAGIVKSLLEAVKYLHDNDVVHRDIKPENVLFESNREDAPVRLIDFGLARRHAEGDPPMGNVVGTAYYMSPELLRGRYDRSVDVWAVGVVAYVLLCGYPPYNGGDDDEVQRTIRKGRLQFQGEQWEAKSDAAVDFVSCLLQRDPKKRLTAAEAVGHPWIGGATAL